jgi:putrescine---pyruvate transaminase
MHTTAMMSSLQKADLEHVWHLFHQTNTYRENQFLAVHGEGPCLIDETGSRYLDAIAGLWAVSLGYSEHRIVEAIHAQLQKLPSLSLIVGSDEPSINLATRLAKLTPGRLNVAFFTSGGSEGVETAIKLARHVAMVCNEPARRKILALQGAYHGLSYGALSATGVTADRWQFGALLPEIVHCPSPHTALRSGRSARDENESERALDFHGPDTFAAILVEPVMGVGGMIPTPPGYLQGLRELCNQYSILLVFDEVATGCGRTGEWFAAHKFQVLSDMIVMAKGMTSGYLPLGAVMIDEAIFDVCERAPTPFMHGFTFGGSPPACAAAVACLEAIAQDGLLQKVAADGAYLLEQFHVAARELSCIRDVRGVGLMLAVDFCDPDDTSKFVPPEFGKIVQRVAMENGVIIRPTYGGTTFNFAPPFICTRQELNRIVEATRAGVESALRGKTA